MALTVSPQPLYTASGETRVAYLRRVATTTFGGLVVSGIVGFMSAAAIAQVPMLQNRIASIVVILGCFGIANWLAPTLVFGRAKLLGFGIAVVFQGIAMGYLLLQALILGSITGGSGLVLIGEALGLTALTAGGLVAYLYTRRRDFSLLGAGLSMVFPVMLVLMVVSFVFPVGGIIGIGIAAVFVVISVLGLLYQTNRVLHDLRTDQHVEGSYLMTMGILVLFWNILSLIMSLSRD